jgi:RimJ/RimL family protein N-acetyltransferase
MNHQFSISYDNIKLRPLAQTDIEQLRQWRNDKSNSVFLRPIPYITKDSQEAWFNSYLKDKDSIIFAIDETKDLKRLVGSVSLYNFNPALNTCEVGKIQVGDKEAHGKGIARKAMALAMYTGFKEFHLNKIIAAVHERNIAAYKSYMDIGFLVVGKHKSPAICGGFDLDIEMDEKTLLEKNPFLINLRYLR